MSRLFPDNGPTRFTNADFALYAGIILFWGTSWIAIMAQLGVVSPEISLFWRFLLAAVLMLLLAWVKGVPLRFSWRDHLRFIAAAVTMFSTNFLMFYYGGLHIKSGLLAVVFSLASIINLILGSLILRQPLEARVAIGGLIGFSGIGLLFWPEIMGTGFNREALIGFAFCVTGTMLFCTGNIISSIIQRRGVPILSATTWGIIYGTINLGLISLARGQAFIIEPTLKYAVSLIWLSVGATIGALFCYLNLLRRIGAARAGYATVLFPIVALAISTFAEDYQWKPLALLGLACALFGNVLVLRRKST